MHAPSRRTARASSRRSTARLRGDGLPQGAALSLLLGLSGLLLLGERARPPV